MGSGETSSHVVSSPRRLAAILAADIAGFSRLMGLDEEGTLARVKRIRREIIEPTLAEHQGRLIKTSGDGFLAMFESPLEAVRCAIVIQQTMLARNTSLSKQQWIQFRIGVNLGDVIVEPDDIFGDGVNIAARLESLAAPGEVYISGGVYEQVKNKLVCGYHSLGDEKLKNITDPVRIYRVLPDPGAVARAQSVNWRTVLVSGVVLALAAAALLAVGFLNVFRAREPQTAGVTYQDPPGFAPAPPSSSQPAQAQSGALPRATQPAEPTARSLEARNQQGRPNPTDGAPIPGLPPPPPPAPPAELPRPAAGTTPAGGGDAKTPQGSQVAVAAPPTRVDRPGAAGSPRTFKDCPRCPELAEVPGGAFMMGSSEDPSEKPVHQVTVQPFAIGRFPVTVGEWQQCAADKACSYEPNGDDRSPARNLSWNDAQQYIAWLSKVAQHPYRLPTEAEWEYAARGGTSTRYWWGNQATVKTADCKGCGEPHDPQAPLPVGSFAPNPFGLHDMGGGVDQWVSDCWHKDYNGAPRDGSSWEGPTCRERVVRGGSWRSDPTYVRAASRNFYDPAVRYPTHGFRVVRQ
jgi:formylglycine-generating enzyme required for sulfatase activity/class 3 adenylate cyclase